MASQSVLEGHLAEHGRLYYSHQFACVRPECAHDSRHIAAPILGRGSTFLGEVMRNAWRFRTNVELKDSLLNLLV